MSGWVDVSGGIGSREIAEPVALPPAVRRLIREASDLAHGDSILTVAVLWERLIWDDEITADRAVFVRWLASQPAIERMAPADGPVERLDRSA